MEEKKYMAAGARIVALPTKSLPVMPEAHTDAGSRPGCPISLQLPADGQGASAIAPMWEPHKKPPTRSGLAQPSPL